MLNPLIELSGRVIPASYTPFKDDAKQGKILGRGALQKYMRGLRKAGLDVVYLLGTTGQGMELTNEFRLDVLNYFISYVPKTTKLIVHVGAKTTEQAVELAEQAADFALRNDRILALSAKAPPTMDYQQELSYLEAIRRVSKRVPFVPYFLGDSLSVPVAQYANDLISLGACAVKFTSHDMDQLEELAGHRPSDLLVFSGEDTLVLEAQKRGAFACIGSTYSWNGDWVAQIRKAQVEQATGFNFSGFSQVLKQVVGEILTDRNDLGRLYAFAKQAIEIRYGASIGDGVDPKFLPVPTLSDEFVSQAMGMVESRSKKQAKAG